MRTCRMLGAVVATASVLSLGFYSAYGSTFGWELPSFFRIGRKAPTSDAVPTPFFDRLVESAKAKPNAGLAEFVATLPPEWRGDYALVYSSRSQQAASLEAPRVIAHDPAYRLLYAFSELPNARGERTLEAVETFGTKPAQFLRLIFPAGDSQPIVVERNPVSCATCHALTKGRGVDGEKGGIFEPYPNWPGFYGSYHNDRMYGISGNGTALMPTPEFETAALDRFTRVDHAGTAYASLIGLSARTISAQNNANLMLGDAIGAQIHFRTFERMTAEAPDFFEFQSLAFAARFPGTETWNQAGAPGMREANPYSYAWGRDVYYERPVYSAFAAEVVADTERRLALARDLYRRYGSEGDRTLMTTTKIFLPTGGEYPFHTGVRPSPYSFVGQQLVHLDPHFSEMRHLLLARFWQIRHPDSDWKIGMDLGRNLDSLYSGTIDGVFFSASEAESYLDRVQTAEELAAFLPGAFVKFGATEFEQNGAMALLRDEWETVILKTARRWDANAVEGALEREGVRGLSANFYRRLRAR